MMVLFVFLTSVIMPIAIISYKCYEIHCIKNQNGCSSLEAIKIYRKQSMNSMDEKGVYFRSSSNSDSEYKSRFSSYDYGRSSRNDDQIYSPSYSHFTENIHHRYDE